MFNFLLNIRNRFNFFLRQKIHVSRKNYSHINEDKSELNFSDEEKNLEKDLINKYKLFDYKNNSSIINYCQNLYTLYFLDKYMEIEKSKGLSVLDIGSKNWFYVQGEYSFFKYFTENLNLDGVELDAYRLYSNLFTRVEVAKFYMKNLAVTTYIPANLLDLNKKYDYIIWILPFVKIEPLRTWELPDSYFAPQKLLKHAYSLLNRNGKMLIINQGEDEFKIQKQLLNEQGIINYYCEKLNTPFYKYKNERYISVIKKD